MLPILNTVYAVSRGVDGPDQTGLIQTYKALFGKKKRINNQLEVRLLFYTGQ